MENANSPEYLEKIKNQLIENLRRTAHVPSVQMQDVPRHALNAMSDEDDAELDDLDEDENKDVRMTQRQWEQRVERENEYEDSDNEDLDKANGVIRNGNRRPGFRDYRSVPLDADADSGAATPVNGGADTAIKSKETDEVIMEDADSKEPEPEAKTTATKEADAGDIAEQETALKNAQASAAEISRKNSEKSDKNAQEDEKPKEKEKRISTMTEGQIMDKLRTVVSMDDPKTLYSKIKKIGQGCV